MRRPTAVPLLLLLASPAAAQVLPSGLEEIELTRSRECVDVLARLDALDAQLAPFAERSQRLLGIAEAIAIEEPSAVELLDETDPLEADVKAWFEADAELAQRFVATQDPAVAEERSTARDSIQAKVSRALGEIQVEANTIIEGTGSLQTEAGSCNGAIFVRSAVLEACGDAESGVCAAARDSAQAGGPYRFVDAAAALWDVQQLRPWTAPGPLAVGPDGQLGGARTGGFTRVGNLVVNLAFYPVLQERDQLEPDQLERIETTVQSLGFEATHPDLVFFPALAVQASVSSPLSGESAYVLHFGPPDSADIILSVPAGTGEPLTSIIELSPDHIIRLQAGEPLTLAALRETPGGDNEAVYAVELTSVNQAATVQALLGYMVEQLSADLERLIPPGSS